LWSAASTQGIAPSLASLFEAYAAGDHGVIARSLSTEQAFEAVRRQLDPAVEVWKRDRQPVQSVFMLDLALAAHNRRWAYWLDVVCTAREFLTSRPLTGTSPAEDELEIAWHKASVALLSGQRRPDFVSEQGIDPLRERMAPEPAADGSPRLIDPWIVLMRGIAEEQRTIVGPMTRFVDNCVARPARGRRPEVDSNSLAEHAPLAIAHYDEAARYPSTRAEALVRKVWLLVQLGRPTEALETLDGLSEPLGDSAVAYWRLLFRGRALAAVGRHDQAATAYEEAIAHTPGAQAPRVGLLALEFKRGRPTEAYRWAAEVRAPHGSSDRDPWWEYWSGDFRFFAERLAQLRERIR
jgi:tetratricopeptide (TPR) repeat protein